MFVIVAGSFSTVSPISGTDAGPFDLARLKSIRNALSQSAGSRSAGGPLVPPREAPISDNVSVISYTPQYADPVELKQIVKELFPDIGAAADVRAGAIHCVGDPGQIEYLRQVFRYADLAPPQIEIEVQLIETAQDIGAAYHAWLSQVGQGTLLNWDNGSPLLHPSQLAGFLRFLNTTGATHIVAKPRITARDGKLAHIKIADRIPYLTTVLSDRATSVQVQNTDVGVDVEVTPKLASANRISVVLKADISHIKYYREFGSGQYPVITSRLTQTEVVIPERSTLVIAGLLDNQQKSTQTTVPVLSDIPLVGDWMKGSQSERVSSDLLVLITPKIVDWGHKKKEALE